MKISEAEHIFRDGGKYMRFIVYIWIENSMVNIFLFTVCYQFTLFVSCSLAKIFVSQQARYPCPNKIEWRENRTQSLYAILLIKKCLSLCVCECAYRDSCHTIKSRYLSFVLY